MQFHASVQQNGGGSGLGLYCTYNIHTSQVLVGEYVSVSVSVSGDRRAARRPSLGVIGRGGKGQYIHIRTTCVL